MNTWCVYIHISPSGKTYVGITHYEDPSKRWGKNGSYYCKRTIFYKAIQHYGWDNFEHKILFHNCSEELAKTLEKAFIAYYKKNDLSYNMTIGGDGHNFGKNCRSKEYRRMMSIKTRINNPNYDKEQYEKHKEARKQNARDYYYAHREKVLEQKKSEHYKEASRKRCIEWRKKHPDYMKNYMKKYKEIHRNKTQIENG